MSDREDNRRAIDYANRERRGVPEGAGPIVWGCICFLAVAGLFVGVLLAMVFRR